MHPDPDRIYLSKPHLGSSEMRYVQEAFESNWVSTVGPNIDALELSFQQMLGRPCVALSSGTAGLHLALRLLHIQPGDEVIVPMLTFAATAFPILYEKALPVFIDSERASWNLDPDLLADFLQKRARANRLPKAIIVVHVFGQPADLDPIAELCHRYSIPLIEDAAEALGASYQGRPVGQFGAFGVFSFNGNKIITGSTGGLLACSEEASANMARSLSSQARDADPDGLNNYLHSEIGFNYRMSNIIAGVVRGQLEVLPARIQRRRKLLEIYAAAFQDLGFEWMPRLLDQFATNWLSCCLLPRDSRVSQPQLIRYLAGRNIEARPVWKPLHTQKVFERFERIGGSVAEELHARSICLPSSSNLSETELIRVIAGVRECFQS
jgi:pyridoxal phosphate-dependent aminotransferase EpsN